MFERNMTTPLSTIAIKRICSDMKDLNRHPLEDEGIYHHYNEQNMQECRIMVIGPEDTPYENGFYFFEFTFPPNYPFEPPKVKYCTQGNNIRFNPNLYVCGKVCLSLINTWEGPKWTSCQTIRSVLISLRGLVLGVKYPLQNEPGYESAVDTRASGFNDVILHENYRTAVVGMLNNPPPGFQVFKPAMIEYLKKHYRTYETKLTQLSKLDKTVAVSPVYNMSVTRNFSGQLEGIKTILTDHDFSFDIPKKTKNILLSETDYSDDEENPDVIRKREYEQKLLEIQAGIQKAEAEKLHKIALEKAQKLKEKEEALQKIAVEKAQKLKEKEESVKKIGLEKEEKKSSERKAPNEPAKNFDVGYKMIGLDKKMYIVKEVKPKIIEVSPEVAIAASITQPKSYKRWVLSEEKEVVLVVKDVDEQSNVSKTTEKKVVVRKAPKESAKNYENGFEMTSSFDNKVYLVKTVGSSETPDKQFKRWVLKK